MDIWLTAAVAALGALSGAALSGYISMRIFRLEARSRDKDELRIALVDYGTAVDQLGIRVDQLPSSSRGIGPRLNRLVSRWYELDWFLGWISTMTFGRATMAAVDRLIAATNRLMLVAPPEVVRPVEEIFCLISDFKPGDQNWKEEWGRARADLAAASRAALDDLVSTSPTT